MARSPINVNGNTLYPRPGGLLNDELIYRPEYGGGGLLDNGADFQNVRTNFAGGILNGAQYNPATNTFQSIAPSGEFTGTPPDGMTQPTEEAGGNGAFTLSELMELQSSLSQANFGNQDVGSVFSSFVDAGGGTFDIDPNMGGSYVVASSLFGTDANGNRVPMNQAEYKYGDRRGTPISKQYAMNVMKAALRGIDESGGMDGGGAQGGPDNDGSADGQGSSGGQSSGTDSEDGHA